MYKGGKHPRAKVVLNMIIGIYYSCIKDAAKCHSLEYTTLFAQLTGKNKNKTDLCIV